jgi:DNA polymerase I-like protein with 3'-5' exonuclease and polymerase domains
MLSLLYDVETNGLLNKLDRVHTAVIRDTKTKEKFRFRRNDNEDTIPEALEMLEKADEVVGHNIILFDNKAIKIVYPDFKFKPGVKMRDTLVIARQIRPDIKTVDFVLAKQGKLPGKYIGSHSLAAWGYRLGLHKGDYAEEMLKKGLDPWASWNIDMEDYCDLDTEVNLKLWEQMLPYLPDENVLELETQIHDLTGVMENNGFPFDIEAARELEKELKSKYDAIAEKTKDKYKYWFAPAKKRYVRPPWTEEISDHMRKKIKPPRCRYW